MNKSTNIVAVFLIVATLFAFVIVPIWLGGGWGWGMMGPGMMGWGFGPLGWIAMPLIWFGPIVAAMLALVWWSIRALRGRKYCPSCGYEALADASYCWRCGKPLPK